MNDLSNNLRAVPGDNSGVDFARIMTDQLAVDYKGTVADAVALLEEARSAPKEINDDETAGKVAAIVKRLRDLAKTFDAYHKNEKLPHKTRAEACDQFFFGWIDKLARRDKKNAAGAADILFARFDDFQQRKLRAEQLKRQREADEAADRERIAAAAAAEAARVEEEARLSADRARAPAQIEKKAEAAQEAAVEADSKSVDHIIATDKADAADLATKAKPADIVRTRFDDGVMGTMQTEKFAEIVDRKLLDKEALWPHIKTEWLQTALNLWAGTTGHAEQMPGARIGKRPKSRIR